MTQHVKDPYTTRDDLDQEQVDSRRDLMQQTVADALEFVAGQLRAGVEPEDMEWFHGVSVADDSRDPRRHYRIVYGHLTSFSEVFRSVQAEVRELLIEQRDHGSPADRARNGAGRTLHPVTRS